MLTVLIESDNKETFEFMVEKAIKDGHIPLWETFRVNVTQSTHNCRFASYYIFMKKEYKSPTTNY